MEKTTSELMAESNHIGVQFLLTDLTAGLTFLDVADTTYSEASRKRNRASARLAYETVLRLLPRVTPSEDEQKALNWKLAELKDRLSSAAREAEAERNAESEADTGI